LELECIHSQSAKFDQEMNFGISRGFCDPI